MKIKIQMVFTDKGGGKHKRELELEAPCATDVLGNIESYLDAVCVKHSWDMISMILHGDGKGEKNEAAP